jgi:hypothetical protein
MYPNCSNGRVGRGDTYLSVCVLGSMKLGPVSVRAYRICVVFVSGATCHSASWWLSLTERVDCCVLQSLYESIKTEPFKIPEDDGNDLMHTFFNPDKEGWLWKQGKLCWQDQLYFVWHEIDWGRGYGVTTPSHLGLWWAGPLCTAFSSTRHLQRRSTSSDLINLC